MNNPPKVAGIQYPIRINKFLAACAMGSRRKVEDLILAGRVCVDGVEQRALSKILEVSSLVTVDGKPVFPVSHIYLLMNKPRGVLSACEDRREKTVLDLLSNEVRALRPFPVGRLDKNSQGLLILTNDGECAQKIIHPSSGIIKLYEVQISHPLTREKVEKWRSGVNIEGRVYVPRLIEEIAPYNGMHFRVALNEGIKREIRLMVQSLGRTVSVLRRIGIGRIKLCALPLGSVVEVSRDQLWQGLIKGVEV